MKKHNFILAILTLCFSQLCAYNQLAYKRLLQGDKNLQGTDLQNAEFKDINVEGVDFTNANLNGATFSNVILTNITLNNTELNQAKFLDTVLTESKILNHTTFNDAVFDNVTIDKTQISDSFFDNATFSNSDFLQTSIQGTSMQLHKINPSTKISFISSELKNLNFDHAKLNNTLVLYCKVMEELNFTHTILNNCCFLGIKNNVLARSNFYGTEMKRCYFSNFCFYNCEQINSISDGLESIFVNFSSNKSDDLTILKSHGAKVNGDNASSYDVFWKTNNDGDFFVDLLLKLGLGIAQIGATQIVLTCAAGWGCTIL
ncbi:hypothetical protein GF322_05145 [Candidatus Dependentiae bacterium]|nr:hypothetical protein [Candidatus Dependentiae bacterium]